MMRPVLFLFLLAVIPTTALGLDENDPKKAYLSAQEAGPAALLQGEYTGTIKAGDDSVKLGVQVIAEGANKLAWAAYVGGLPGDGWNGEAPLRGPGEIEGTTAVLKGDTGRGEIKDGSLVIFNNDNVRVGEISRTNRVSPSMGRKPPEGAVVLFDGTTADHFEGGRITEDKLLMEGVNSKEKFQSVELHLEFQLSFMPNGRGQGRSNSGCYLQGRYEVQILDSFGLSGEHNECGGIYTIKKPNVNMCFPPLSWQTYDIEYHVAKFDSDGKKTDDAWMTVKHNGVVIHDKVKLPHATTAAPLKEGPEPGPLHLQNHGDPLRYRNIWYKTIEG